MSKRDFISYIPKNYTLDNSKRCIRCEEPGVIVWRGKVRVICPECFLRVLNGLMAEYDEKDWAGMYEDDGAP